MQNKEQITGALSLAAEEGSSGHIGEVWPTNQRGDGSPNTGRKSRQEGGGVDADTGSHPADFPNGHFYFFNYFLNFLYLCLTVLSLHYCAGFTPVQRVRATPQCC